MFTGLIEEVGTVAARQDGDLRISAKIVLDDLKPDDSIAVDGACLTVTALDNEGFSVKVSPETYSRTTLGERKPGDHVNLERAMMATSRFGGHFVQGHVDGVGRIVDVVPQGEFSMWHFEATQDAAKYLINKGSIAIDGISLTVVEPQGNQFSVAIIPTTLKKTTLQTKQAGESVNLEADMLAKHIAHLLEQMKPAGLSRETLKQHGFA